MTLPDNARPGRRGAVARLWSGDGLQARALRGSAMTFLSYGGGQFLRLASNLILTRLLFPEAFGLMALVQVFMTGLQMFSDVGLNASIVQSKRGDDPVFLNTGWTLQIIRGVVLALAACALAIPAARFYGQDMLLQLMPVVGLNAFLLGFISTKVATANRHIALGRLTILELSTQLVGSLAMIGLALAYESVWALMIGILVGTVYRVVMSHVILPGQANRLHWDKPAFSELFHFGKYIFVGSILGFLIGNADRAVLGKHVSLTELAVYNIAFFLATVPLVLSQQMVTRVMFPLYSARPPTQSDQNRRSISKARFLLTGGMFCLCLVLGLIGDHLVQFLYEPRYHLAGPILVLLSLSVLPNIVVASYSTLLLSMGNSRGFTTLQFIMAALQVTVLLVLVPAYGLIGAILAPVISISAAYPVIVWMMRRYDGWDLRHDAVFFALTIAIFAVVLWVNDTAWGRLLALIPG